MKKITKMPIGLGMNHLEQEIAACHAWNSLIDQGLNSDAHLPIVGRNPDLFATNRETGLSLSGSGLIEVSDEMVRLTPKAIELLKKFSENQ